MKKHRAYYNENDKFAAAWLRELIVDGLIAPGDVDERSIVDVKASDLEGYDQHHFFAGIGGWSYALRLAGWPDDRPVWSGSCPCQPLSLAGSRKGHADERHLWPAFHALIAECRPATVFGEQIASPLGLEWLAGVRADLEGDRYAVGAANLCAAGVGAPHIRQRIFWVAYATSGRQRIDGRAPQGARHAHLGGENVSLADAHGDGRPGDERRPGTGEEPELAHRGRLGDAGCSGDECGRGPDEAHGAARSDQGDGHRRQRGWAHARYSSVLIACADGKFRRIPADEEGQPESAFFPLAHGVPNRLGTLRGAGNAINPVVAAEFVCAFLEAETQI